MILLVLLLLLQMLIRIENAESDSSFSKVTAYGQFDSSQSIVGQDICTSDHRKNIDTS